MSWIVFLSGVFVGVAVTWLVQMRAHRAVLRPHVFDTQYEPARRAVLRHLRVHGTLNLQQLERMLDIPGTTALRYLDQMVQDGLLREQGHRGKGAFYTPR